MTSYPSALLVFAAGILSFLSPCVLPLIPSYLGILGGTALLDGTASLDGTALLDGTRIQEQDTGRKAGKAILVMTTICFILGFSFVFVVMSIIMSTTFLLMSGISFYIQIAAGIIVIILGLNILFDFISVFNYEKRLPISGKLRGKVGAFLAGAAFGSGWTPCIGPILAGVLFLAGQSGQAGVAALYLGLYSLGLGIPFLLAAAFFDRFLVSAKWFRSRLPLIQKISGILVIIIGILILSGHFVFLNRIFSSMQFGIPSL